MASSDSEKLNGDVFQAKGREARKYAREDFDFEKILGEGSYSTVVLATDKKTKKQYALKILEKRHIIREKKVQYVSREKEVMLMLEHPFFIQLYFTFQDKDSLYFGLTYAKRGELLDYIRKVGSFDEAGSRFYAAEIVLALEYLHRLGIIHRDLKPENILLDDMMHIRISDFGSAKVLEDGEDRAKSFVGTPEYVSPELLQEKVAFKSSDLWAFGCIVYQFIAGRPPFHAANEYLCFQKIIKIEYAYPEGFNEVAADLVSKLLVSDHTQRLGCEAAGGYQKLKEHPFFSGIDWDGLPEQEPPKILPYLPSNTKDGEALKSDYDMARPVSDDDFDERFLLAWGLGDTASAPRSNSDVAREGRQKLLAKQARESPWHKFINNELIVKHGLVDKRKGLFAKRRQLILTDAPRLYYIDPVDMELKGEIPWSDALQVEQKNWKIFFIHTPNRTYYLEDPTGNSQDWCSTIGKWKGVYLQRKKESAQKS